jgi:branched-chain amino acid transport system permease protein
LILEPAQQYFTIQFSQNGYYLVIYGALFLAIILLLPEGIVPTLRRVWLKRTAGREQAPPPAPVRAAIGPADQAGEGSG